MSEKWGLYAFVLIAERQYAGTGGLCKEFVMMLRCLTPVDQPCLVMLSVFRNAMCAWREYGITSICVLVKVSDLRPHNRA